MFHISTAEHTVLEESAQKEKKWLKNVEKSVNKQQLNKDSISWAVYHASQQRKIIDQPVSNIALSLFYQSAHTVSMIRHAMDIVHKLANPGETPIITMDHPLYAMCENIQWIFCGTYSAFVVMLGPLHTEKAFLRLLGEC